MSSQKSECDDDPENESDMLANLNLELLLDLISDRLSERQLDLGVIFIFDKFFLNATIEIKYILKKKFI